MTLHKLTAGSGYDYLTRQVAALDATDKGHTGLASYYAERGESPGVWVGSGLAGIDGLAAGDVVTAEQMRLLFGSGYHPLAGQQIDGLDASSTAAEWTAAGRLGAPFKIYPGDASELQIEVARRVATLQTDAPGAGPGTVTPEVRARVRTEVTNDLFVAEHGRRPVSETELAGYVARQTRPRTTAVAGFDLTFSPVKSVSTLWAIADIPTAALIERAHQAAVADALAFIEAHALFTRTGRNGIRQVEVTGLVATAFTHRDSRAGDPDLHTHVAVANKVQTRPGPDGTPGRWLSVDGRMLYQANVAASETYNTRLEHHLRRLVGVEFTDRDDRSPVTGQPAVRSRGDKRTVREIRGVDPALMTAWSSRRRDVVARQSDLAAAFRRDHGRPPTPVEALHLAQQANLETRQAKHTARTLSEQRATWHTQAVAVLGGEQALSAMVDRALSPTLSPTQASPGEVTIVDLQRLACRVVDELEQRRATWQTWHVRAEAERQIRAGDYTHPDHDGLTDHVVQVVLHQHSLSLAGPTDADLNLAPPPDLDTVRRRSDGSSVYDIAGATHYTSNRILTAEQRLVDAAARTGAPVVPPVTVDQAIAAAAAIGPALDDGHAALVRAMATSGRRVQLAIAPAGTGKTTALQALATAWTTAGGNVVALAPSAAAAAVLDDALNEQHSLGTAGGETLRMGPVHTDTLAKLTHTLTRPDGTPAWVDSIGRGTMLLIDEAGMADTLTLDSAVGFALARGATVRLVGDDSSSPPSAPAASSATSTAPTVRCDSTSSTASPTPTKQPPPCAYATATPPPSSTTSTMTASTSATSSASWPTSIRPGPATQQPASTPSCSPPPKSRSAT